MDVKDLAAELREYGTKYDSCFSRRGQREKYLSYLQGLVQTLPNKSIETMILHQKGDDPNEIRAMQHFISEGAWDDTAVLARHRQEVEKDLGEADGVLIVDGSDFPKQGDASVGVKRQWCGQLGKVANCQGGVFLGYASRAGYTLLDRRLYLPAEWVAVEAFAERRRRCGVPEDVTFQTKPELALAMVAAVATAATLPFRWLVCDEAFGNNPAFLDGVGQHGWYLAEVAADTHVWQERPPTAVPAWSGQGRRPSQLQLVEGQPASQTVAAIVDQLPPSRWQLYTIKEGEKGPLVADFVLSSVVNVRHRLPGQTVWLLCRRDPLSRERQYYLSNAPAEIPLADFVRVSGMRWPIESCFEEGKQELGLGDYQVRSWLGWHHHMTLCILAHFFIVRTKRRLKDKAPDLSLPQAILLLKAVLPQPNFDLETTLKVVNYYQRRHRAARRSHRKRRMAQLSRSGEVSL